MYAREPRDVYFACWLAHSWPVKGRVPVLDSQAFLPHSQYLLVRNESTGTATSNTRPRWFSLISVGCVACSVKATPNLFLILPFFPSFGKVWNHPSWPAASPPPAPDVSWINALLLGMPPHLLTARGKQRPGVLAGFQYHSLLITSTEIYSALKPEGDMCNCQGCTVRLGPPRERAVGPAASPALTQLLELGRDPHALKRFQSRVHGSPWSVQRQCLCGAGRVQKSVGWIDAVWEDQPSGTPSHGWPRWLRGTH